MTPQGIVMGRLLADIYPLQIETPLEEVRTFERFVGGFAGNVGTGLARLGVATTLVSGVGDDGHGRFILRFLEAEGIDTEWVHINSQLNTALAFCEIWPPDRFPFLAYRFPTCPDWEIRAADLPIAELQTAALLYVSGTGFGREPSRQATYAAMAARSRPSEPLTATILDLDWREPYWESAIDYAVQMQRAVSMANIVIGSDAEWEAAGMVPEAALRSGATRVFVKHGGRGATLLTQNARFEVDPVRVQVLNGLGAGDAFAASVGASLLAGSSDAEMLHRANAAGALVATRLGCSVAMPSAAELAAFVAALPAESARAVSHTDW